MTSKAAVEFRAAPIPPVRPVTVGTVYGIDGCGTPGGKAIVVWHDGSSAYSSALLSPDDLATQGSVSSAGQVTTIVTGPAGYTNVTGVTCWVAGGVLRALVAMWGSSGGLTKVYAANNVENPTSWSEVSTPQSFVNGNGMFKDSLAWRTVGTVTVLGSGRLVCPFVCWFGIFLQPGIGIWTSDDNGASWTNRLLVGSDNNAGEVGSWMSHDIAADAGGTLYFNGNTQTNRTWTSTDGVSWTMSVVGSADTNYSVESGGNLWSLRRASPLVKVYDATVDPLNPTNHVDTGESMDVSSLHGDRVLQDMKSQIIGGKLYVFVSDLVGTPIRSGWLVGQVGIG